MTTTLKGFSPLPRVTEAQRAQKLNEAEGWARHARAVETIRGIQMLAYGAALQSDPAKRDVTDLVLARIAAYAQRETDLTAAYEARVPKRQDEPAIPAADVATLREFLTEYTGRAIPQGNAELFEAAFEAVTSNGLFDDSVETRAQRGEILEVLSRWAAFEMTGWRTAPAAARRKGDLGAN